MRCRIRNGEVDESTAGDRIVIVGITPASDAVDGIRVPEGAVLKGR